jgi:hypothetical protein
MRKLIKKLLGLSDLITVSDGYCYEVLSTDQTLCKQLKGEEPLPKLMELPLSIPGFYKCDDGRVYYFSGKKLLEVKQ